MKLFRSKCLSKLCLSFSVIPIKSLATRRVVDVEIEYVPEDVKGKQDVRSQVYARQASHPARPVIRASRERIFSAPEENVSDNEGELKTRS